MPRRATPSVPTASPECHFIFSLQYHVTQFVKWRFVYIVGFVCFLLFGLGWRVPCASIQWASVNLCRQVFDVTYRIDIHRLLDTSSIIVAAVLAASLSRLVLSAVAFSCYRLLPVA